jgi:hypothetical protein
MRATALFALLAAGALGCALPDGSATVTASCPDRASFTSVSPYLEAGCGTIDCHGQRPRPLRIAGYTGLRLDPADLPGGNPTTVAEVDANWRSVCGLQPETMTDVVAGVEPQGALLLLQKPRGEVHHKGNTLIQKGDVADRCLTGWLSGHVDAEACAAAAMAQQH